ncbi:MAG: hypothetical protein VX871_09395 [Pseudomonadota bacterium]|nr:hypothetical protein [Pseudomonadota bacterium]
MTNLIYFGALWLGLSVASHSGMDADWMWALCLPATYVSLLPVLLK